MKSGNSKDNVIDLTSRMTEPDARARLKGIKVRLDLEHAKVAVSTSLLSIVILVTLANNNLMSKVVVPEQVTFSSSSVHGGRGIASVDAGQMIVENPTLVKKLSSHDLGPKALVGHQPSQVENLAFGYLEGKYAVHLNRGQLTGIEFSDSNRDDAKKIDNLTAFVESQRALLPEFSRVAKVSSDKEGEQNVEVYQLLTEGMAPVAKVEFHLDVDGHLLAMAVSHMQVAVK